MHIAIKNIELCVLTVTATIDHASFLLLVINMRVFFYLSENFHRKLEAQNRKHQSCMRAQLGRCLYSFSVDVILFDPT